MSAQPGSTRIFCSIDELPAGFGPTALAIGNFDGVHLGHREILSAVVADARARNALAVAVTFEPHPEQFLRPDRAPQLITPLDERLRLLAETGVDAVVVLRFDAALAGLTPREFVEKILFAALNTKSIHEGENFRFGRGAAAGVEELAAFGREFGFEVKAHQAVHVRGLEVSSSAIRALVAAGDMRRARWMLGRPFAVLSTQARGRGVGSRLLVPTVNLAEYNGLLPANGVYVTRLRVAGRAFEAVTNVGNRPTFEGVGFGVETHILDFEPVELHPTGEDLSVGAPVQEREEAPLELEFLLRLRGERKFPSPEALKAQIMKDVARAKKYFRRAE
ncbi:MAG: bifunctional riboflavin kinase/FAD synthetase [Terracidiphilus sp.]